MTDPYGYTRSAYNAYQSYIRQESGYPSYCEPKVMIDKSMVDYFKRITPSGNPDAYIRSYASYTQRPSLSVYRMPVSYSFRYPSYPPW